MARRWENPSVGKSTRSREGALFRTGIYPSPRDEGVGGIVYSPRAWESDVCVLCVFCMFSFVYFDLTTNNKYHSGIGQGTQTMRIVWIIDG